MKDKISLEEIFSFQRLVALGFALYEEDKSDFGIFLVGMNVMYTDDYIRLRL